MRKQQNQLKEKNSEMFSIIREELNKIDPIGVGTDNVGSKLIDEYDLENERIILTIKQCNNEIVLANKICEIFIETTTLDYEPEFFLQCAKNILERIKNL